MAGGGYITAEQLVKARRRPVHKSHSKVTRTSRRLKCCCSYSLNIDFLDAPLLNHEVRNINGLITQGK